MFDFRSAFLQQVPSEHVGAIWFGSFDVVEGAGVIQHAPIIANSIQDWKSIRINNSNNNNIVQMSVNSKQSQYPVVAGKYLLGPLIGKGAFGSVYLATVEGQQTLYAVKKQQQSAHNPQLMYEYKILRNFDKVIGFPKVFWAGQQDRCTYMVIELLGPNLEDLFVMCGKSFSLKTVLMLADQMLHKIQHFHTMNYVHRDLKPQNFLIGLQQKSHIVYLVDFGLCKRYRDVKTHQHIPYKQKKSFTGTVRYSSINVHFGIEQSRRDDLEAIAFILIYFLKGYLPWQGIKANNKNQKHEKIQEKKLSMPLELLCKGLPIEFSTFMNYCRTLRFQQKPDYKFMRKLFRQLFDRVGYTWDFNYDWCNFQTSKQMQTSTLNIKIEKKGDQIDQNEKHKPQTSSQLGECLQVEEDDIGIKVGNISGFRNFEGSDSSSLMQEEVSNIGLVTNNNRKGFKLLQQKNANIW